MTKKIEPAALTPDNSFQPRIELNMDHVESMVAALKKNSALFDGLPIKVWKIGESLMIVDGFHRFEAFRELNIKKVMVEIRETKRESVMSDDEYLELSRSEALQYAIQANQHNGSPLRRSRADNQRAIRLLLENPMTRKNSDASIAETVGVRGPTVAKIRKEKPEYQTDERIGSDGRSVNRERISSNAGNKLRRKAAPVQVANLLSVADRPKTQGRDVVDDRLDLSGTRADDDGTLLTVDAQEVSDFRERFEAPVDGTSHSTIKESPTNLRRGAVDDGHKIQGTSQMIGAKRSAANGDDFMALYEQIKVPVSSTNHVTLNNKSTPLDEHTVQSQNKQPQASYMTEAKLSAADAAELRLFREHFNEIRRLGSPYLEEFAITYAVFIDTCNLREFGKVMFDHTQSLNQQVTQLKKELEQANFAASDPAKPAAELKANSDQAAATPEKANSWEERLLAISPAFEPVFGRLREGISTGRNWKWFSNDRTWRKTPSLVDKQLRDEAAALIQSLLKGGQ